MSFEDKIIEWVAIDNKIRKYNGLLKQDRSIRTQLTDEIISYVEVNGMHHSVIEITDGKLKFQNTRTAQPLTFKFIKECLIDCLGNDESVEQIMHYIKTKRHINYTTDVKRTYN